jgi:hypothetical protein
MSRRFSALTVASDLAKARNALARASASATWQAPLHTTRRRIDRERRRAEAALEARADERERLRTRPVPVDDWRRISPIAILVADEEIIGAVANAWARPLERRVLVFLFAACFRGRGRITNALRREADRLNRAERLLSFLTRIRTPRNPRQGEFRFMTDMAWTRRPPDTDWSLYLRRTAWNFDRK